MASKYQFPRGSVFLFLSLIVLLIVVYLVQPTQQNKIPPELAGVLRPHFVPLKPFTLTDHNLKTFSEQRFKGKWSFVFFGYTNCPDICPTTLNILQQVHNILQDSTPGASDMQVIFVSVDPQRDTPETLKKYTEYFNQEFIALTGHPSQLMDFSRQFGASYVKEKTDTPGDYLISHTSSIFLVDPSARVVGAFSPPHEASTIAELYRAIHELI